MLKYLMVENELFGVIGPVDKVEMDGGKHGGQGQKNKVNGPGRGGISKGGDRRGCFRGVVIGVHFFY